MSSDLDEDPADVALVAGQLRAVGRLEEAERRLRQALAGHPDDADLLAELASVLRTRGDLPGAEAAARAAVAAAPLSTVPLLRLTLVLLQQNRIDEAAATASTVVGMDPDEAAAWAYLALAGAGRRRERDRAVARDAYRRAIELQPSSGGYRWFGAVVEHSFGNVYGARRMVEDGLALDPQSEQLLALRAEYAPIADQPGLLVDVLTANPTDDESREILDAAVTWERRLALTGVLLSPPLVAAVALVGRLPAATILVAAAVMALPVLLGRRYRRRTDLLPVGYRDARRAAARGTRPMRVLAVASAGATLLGAFASIVDLTVGGLLLAAAVVLGGAAVVAVLPDDRRALTRCRVRSGRFLGTTAWRYGSLRQELVLWTALGIGALGLVIAAVPGGPPSARAAVALASAAVLVLLLVEAFDAGVNAPQRYLRALTVRYRLVAIALMTLGLLNLSLLLAVAGELPPTR